MREIRLSLVISLMGYTSLLSSGFSALRDLLSVGYLKSQCQENKNTGKRYRDLP